MHPDLILEPELLPPMPLAPLAQRPSQATSALVGFALAAVIGVWGAAAGPFSTGTLPIASTAVSSPPAAMAPAPVVLTIDNPAAGQPAVLAAPANGEGEAGASAPSVAGTAQ